MSRIKKEKQLIGEDILDIPPEIKRFATPEIVARYRAERLACDTILDLCSGYGFQTFAFAKTCKHVIAVEKNSDALAASKKFADKLGLTNITFFCGDVLSSEIFQKISLLEHRPQIIFCDPQRDPAEKQRSLETIQPNITELLALYRKITPNIAIELPPHISNTALDAEYEYLSVEGALNRLTIYFGALQQAQKKILLLPEHISLSSSDLDISEFSQLQESADTSKYLYLLEPNPALLLTALFKEAFISSFSEQQLEQLLQSKELVQIQYGKKIFFLCTVLCTSPFFACYKIMEHVSEKQKTLLSLQKLNAGKVLLRYGIDPKHYWKERAAFEKHLTGTKTLHLFFFDVALICERLHSPKPFKVQ